MPKSYMNVVMVQMAWVGTFHEALNLLLEEETKNVELYKGENFTLYNKNNGVNFYRPKRPNLFHFENPNWKSNRKNKNNGPKKPLGNCI